MTTYHKPDDYWNWNYRCILPQTLTIQFKAPATDVKLDGIYCAYWISVGADDCFTEHLIRTDAEGKIVQTRDQLIANMKRLGADYDEQNPLDNFPVTFDFKVWSSEQLLHKIKNMERELSGHLQNETEQRFRHLTGLPEEAQKKMIQEIEEHIEELKSYFPDIKQNRNQSLNIREDHYKVSGHWTEEKDYYYELML